LEENAEAEDDEDMEQTMGSVAEDDEKTENPDRA
jgi:hypothetical protein